MKDVAQVARVSIKTVSRVVNGEESVAPALAERVHTAIAALNYHPHIGASTLRRSDGRTKTIGLLLEDVGNPFSAAVHRAVEDLARTRGVQVLTGSLDEDPDRERELTRTFTARRADGLIMAPVSEDLSHVAAGVGNETPVVLVDRPAIGLRGDEVLSTNVTGATEAVRHLIVHGHHRIAYLGDLTSISTARHRHQGYLGALEAAGIDPDPALIAHDLHTAAAVEGAAMTMLAGLHPPTAMFTSRNSITVGVVRTLRRLNLHHDIALVGFDDFPLADLLQPAVTVVAQDPATIGRTAAEALFARIDGYTGDPRQFWIPTTLIRRGSGEIRPSAQKADRRVYSPL
jgi:LacI family transcriptional regulator